MLGLFSRVHRTYKEKEKKGKEKKDEKKSKKEVKDEDKSKDVKESPRSKRSEKVMLLFISYGIPGEPEKSSHF